ncbi:MAG: hypothetical protein U0520_00105 [Candidatus Saccharimonadales bacterium]
MNERSDVKLDPRRVIGRRIELDPREKDQGVQVRRVFVAHYTGRLVVTGIGPDGVPTVETPEASTEPDNGDLTPEEIEAYDTFDREADARRAAAKADGSV